MRLKQLIKMASFVLLLTSFQVANAVEPTPAVQKTVVHTSFASPDEAAKALVQALRSDDSNALFAVIGPSSRDWLSSGDKVADRREMDKFLAAYDRKNSIQHTDDDTAILLVDTDDWPFPAPIVRKGDAWMFDDVAGREELINRRVGRNELDAIQTLLAIVDAQREYAADDVDGNGYHDYAQRFASGKGKKDGLFWQASAGETLSPLGPLVSAAAREGYTNKIKNDKPIPYHGYRYRILTAQGKHAPDGAYDYLVNGKMIGGFAIVAYPARYDVSGVMTFIVNHAGVVYEKDLGKTTEADVLKMKSFDPDSEWKKVQ